MKKTGFLKATAQTLARQHKRALALFAATALVIVYSAPLATALTVTNASLALSDSRPSPTSGSNSVRYTYTGSNFSSTAISCVKMVFSTTVAGSTVPTSMSTTAAALDASSNFFTTPGAWTTTAGVNGTVTLTNNTPAAPNAGTNRLIALNNFTNSSVADTTYYLKFTTHTDTACTSNNQVDTSTVAFIITNGTAVTMNIDPTLTFTVAGTASGTACNSSPIDSSVNTVTTTPTTVPFGSVTAAKNTIGVQNLTTTTNAGTGYTVFARYSGKPVSGTINDIDDLGGATNGAPTAFAAAGTEAYGYTTNDSSLSVTGSGATRFTATGGNKWAPFTTTNAEVAYSTSGVTNDPVCVGHQVAVSATTPAGSYATSVIYTATPIY